MVSLDTLVAILIALVLGVTIVLVSLSSFSHWSWLRRVHNTNRVHVHQLHADEDTNICTKTRVCECEQVPAYIITTGRSDRVQGLEPLLYHLPSFTWSWVQALVPHDISVDYSADEPADAVLACLLSHLKALRAFVTTKMPVALIAEDDVRFHVSADALIRSCATWLRDRELNPGTLPKPDILSVGYLPSSPSSALFARISPVEQGQVQQHHDKFSILWPINSDQCWGLQAYLITAEGARRILAILDTATFSEARRNLARVNLGHMPLIADWVFYAICGRAILVQPAAIECPLPSDIEPGREYQHQQWNIQAAARREIDLDAYRGYEPIDQGLKVEVKQHFIC